MLATFLCSRHQNQLLSQFTCMYICLLHSLCSVRPQYTQHVFFLGCHSSFTIMFHLSHIAAHVYPITPVYYTSWRRRSSYSTTVVSCGMLLRACINHMQIIYHHHTNLTVGSCPSQPSLPWYIHVPLIKYVHSCPYDNTKSDQCTVVYHVAVHGRYIRDVGMPRCYCPSYVLLCGPISLTIMDLQTRERAGEGMGVTPS